MEHPLLQTAAVYTFAPWEHALAVLRITGPLKAAGFELVRGNQGLEIHPEQVSPAGLVVMQRDFAFGGAAYEQVLAQAQAQRKPVILDLDDLLLELPENHPDRGQQYLESTFLPVLRAILEADAVTASTQPLCEYLARLNPRTWLLPNYLNDTLWRLRPPRPPDTHQGPVIIGYMGGASHLPDLESVLPALEAVLQKYGPGVRLCFWGLQPPPALAGRPNVECIPLNLVNYADFAATFQEQACDIFIAPLVDQLFNRCKSAIKFLEYSALGVPGVYSRISPYAGIIEQGVNGFLASTTDEWKDSLAQLIENPTLRYQTGRQAQQTVRQNWLLSQHTHEWVQVYAHISAAGKEPAPKEGISRPALLQLLHQLTELHGGLAAALAEEEGAARRLAARLAEQERQYQAVADRLSSYEGSLAWGLVERFRKIGRKLAPPGSRLEKALQSSRWNSPDKHAND